MPLNQTTNRIDRLEERGLVERTATDDRRKVVVRLTPVGRDLVDAVAASHLEVEAAMLARLSPRQRGELVDLLRTLLLSFGDQADAVEGASAPASLPSSQRRS
jgi:DNA-binding MarR family transcriptional regulator